MWYYFRKKRKLLLGFKIFGADMLIINIDNWYLHILQKFVIKNMSQTFFHVQRKKIK